MLATTMSKCPRGRASGRDERGIDAVRAARWRGSRAAPADRRRCRRPTPRRASQQRSRGCRSRTRSRAPTRRRASCSSSQSRHSRVVGCEPVPNASPGSSARLTTPGSRRLAPRRHDAAAGRDRRSGRTALASRAPNPGRRPRSVSCAGNGLRERTRPPRQAQRRRRRPRRTARPDATPARAARPARPARRIAPAPAVVPANGSVDVDRERAGRRAARPTRRRRSRRRRRSAARVIASSCARASASPVIRPACASPAAPRDSGSTCRRA